MIDLVFLQSISYVAAAIGVLIAAIYYVFTLRINQRSIRHTLETRQAQIFMQLYALYDNREFFEDYGKICNVYKYEDLADWTKKYGPSVDIGAYAAWIRVGRFLDGAGLLVRKNLIDAELVIDQMREVIMSAWVKMGPWVHESRQMLEHPQLWENFEYLANEARKRYPKLVLAERWDHWVSEVDTKKG